MGRQHDSDGEEGDIYGRRDRPHYKPAEGWSTSGRIIVPQVPAGADKNPTVEIGQLQIHFPRPGYHTVQFNLRQVRPPIDQAGVLNPLVVRGEAEITWTVRGNAVRRIINLTDGTSISGTGESCNVSIYDGSFVNGLTDVEYEYEVSAQVTPGQRPDLAGSQPPIKNAEEGFLSSAGGNEFNAGGSFDIVNPAVAPALTNLTAIIIPQGCGINSYHLSISVLSGGAGTQPTGDDLLITQQGGTIGSFQDLGNVNYDSINRWNPIVPGARFITITNNYEVAAASHLRGFILFGVDG